MYIYIHMMLAVDAIVMGVGGGSRKGCDCSWVSWAQESVYYFLERLH